MDALRPYCAVIVSSQSVVQHGSKVSPRFAIQASGDDSEARGMSDKVDEWRRTYKKKKKQASKSKLKQMQRREVERERQEQVMDAFHTFYEAQLGERWGSLLSALQDEPRVCCLANVLADPEFLKQSIGGLHNVTRLSFTKLVAYESTAPFPHPGRDPHNIYAYYLLDVASVLATEALETRPGDHVLDLCAAPGGKSLCILLQLCLPRGMLTANELSSDRRRRLLKVILDYIPEHLRHCVKVTGKDGTRWSETVLYDKVLIDAPCSSERHLLHDCHELYRWTQKRSINCAMRQLALLATGLRSVHVGGTVVYSTCSISNLENDGLITKALVKAKGKFQTVQRTWDIGEKTEHGWIILPDTGHGWGPLYFSILKRIS